MKTRTSTSTPRPVPTPNNSPAAATQHAQPTAPAAEPTPPATPPALPGTQEEHQFDAGGASRHLQAPTTSTDSTSTSQVDPQLSSSLRSQMNTASLATPIAMSGGSGIGHGRMGVNSGTMVRSSSGPIDAAAWDRDPSSVLGHLTQRSASGAGASARAHQNDRCGPSSLLGAAIMNGREETGTFLQRAADNRGSTLTSNERTRLRSLADNVRSGNTSFEELNEAQGLLYRSGNNRSYAPEELSNLANNLRGSQPTLANNLQNISQRMAAHQPISNIDQQRALVALRSYGGRPDAEIFHLPDPQHPGRQDWYIRNASGEHARDASAYDDGELADLARRTNDGVSVHRDVMERDSIEDLSRRPPQGLANGQAATFRLQGGQNSLGSDHYITVGRNNAGTLYVYNPDPRPGDATLTTGRQVQRALRQYDGRLGGDGDGDLPNLIITHNR